MSFVDLYKNREDIDTFASDISKDALTKVEIYDIGVINQSIESIISTNFGERLFKPNFGSLLPRAIFDTLDRGSAEELLESIIESIKTFEDRVSIIERDASVELKLSENSMILKIPYYINKTNIKSVFDKKIIF